MKTLIKGHPVFRGEKLEMLEIKMAEVTILLSSLLDSLIRSFMDKRWFRNDPLSYNKKRSIVYITPQEYIKIYEKNGDKILRSEFIPPKLGEERLGTLLVELEH